MFTVCPKCGYMYDDSTGGCPQCSMGVAPQTPVIDNYEPVQDFSEAYEPTVSATDNSAPEPVYEPVQNFPEANEPTVADDNVAQMPVYEPVTENITEAYASQDYSVPETGESTDEKNIIIEPISVINDTVYMDDKTEAVFDSSVDESISTVDEFIDPVITIDNTLQEDKTESVFIDSHNSYVDIASSSFDDVTVSVFNTSEVPVNNNDHDVTSEPTETIFDTPAPVYDAENEPENEVDDSTYTIVNEQADVINNNHVYPVQYAQNYNSVTPQQSYQPVSVAPMVYSAPQNIQGKPKKDGKIGIIILVAALIGITIAGGVILSIL